jgi:hypothetical protein
LQALASFQEEQFHQHQKQRQRPSWPHTCELNDCKEMETTEIEDGTAGWEPPHGATFVSERWGQSSWKNNPILEDIQRERTLWLDICRSDVETAERGMAIVTQVDRKFKNKGVTVFVQVFLRSFKHQAAAVLKRRTAGKTQVLTVKTIKILASHA